MTACRGTRNQKQAKLRCKWNMWRTDGQRNSGCILYQMCNYAHTHRYIHYHRASSATRIHLYKCCRAPRVCPTSGDKGYWLKPVKEPLKLPIKASSWLCSTSLLPLLLIVSFSSSFPLLSSFNSTPHFFTNQLFNFPLYYLVLLSSPLPPSLSKEKRSFIVLAGNNLPKAPSNESATGALAHIHTRTHMLTDTHTHAHENHLE